MKRKGLLITCLVTVLVLSLVGACAAPAPTPAPAPPVTPAPAPAPEEPIELIFASFITDKHDTSVAFQGFVERVSERTKGMVSFRSYYGGALGGAKELFPLVRDGTVDIVCIIYDYYPALFRLVRVSDIPFTGYNMPAKQLAYMQLIEEVPEMTDELTNQNVKLLFPCFSPATCTATNRKIETIEDIKGLKVRCDGYELVAWDVWGGVPVEMPSGEYYEALSRGVIDAISGTSLQAMVKRAVPEIVDYMIDTGWGSAGCLAILMNTDSYDELPADIQKIFDEEGATAAAGFAEIRQEGVRTSVPKAIEEGVEIYALSDEFQAQLKAMTEPVIQAEWIADMKKGGYSEEMARRVITRFLELTRQYEPQVSFKEFVEIYEELQR